jgi:hypothetical protein
MNEKLQVSGGKRAIDAAENGVLVAARIYPCRKNRKITWALEDAEKLCFRLGHGFIRAINDRIATRL